MATVSVKPLSLALGAEVSCGDVRALSDAGFKPVYEALLDQYLGFAFTIVGHVPDRSPPVKAVPARVMAAVGVAGE